MQSELQSHLHKWDYSFCNNELGDPVDQTKSRLKYQTTYSLFNQNVKPA